MIRNPQALTVAGSDSGGGAGIQADLKAFAMNGVYGASVITALTAQNSLGVSGIHAPEPEFVALQLSAVLDDLSIDAAKTGMLFSHGIIAAIAPLLKAWGGPLVVDPVCVATSGHRLLQPDAVEALKTKMAPLAALFTPNRHEAELLVGMDIRTREDCFEACRRLLDLGPAAVLLKGGHFEDFAAVTDWLAVRGQEPIPLIQPKVDTKNVHGTGCSLSAAIAANLARGMELTRAVTEAQGFLNLGLRASYRVGRGPGPLNHAAPLVQARARAEILEELADTGRRLAERPFAAGLLPRFGGNMAAALPWATRPAQVAAFDGGITSSLDGHVLLPGCPRYGAAPELGVRLTAAAAAAGEGEGGLSWALTLRLAENTLKGLDAAGLRVSAVDHGMDGDEPRGRDDDLDWNTLNALRAAGHGPEADVPRSAGGADSPADALPDALIDTSGDFPGPVVVLLARDAAELLDKLDAMAGSGKGAAKGSAKSRARG
ncbi:phosphomethylpyrimidine kinase [Desulfovibrio sp. X2]|uniref:bifunctional hydroxymethylpyrimidine kinase/phosphomethylpyrimidine kinase n=1 Tax=Desulfovibrio sp. X2 TaxID=941449 RepID=UPI000358CD3D|nr:bifunctional hydroxymethylpyrimidine kinase/phosphomethylpyrimidine kinase [Desulfovibrio sp. X2]EPR37601.1 phosphomethylpyrimidine kinase [Desulfovibrio sp. X2]